MEDAHVVHLDGRSAYFGVFDGHGGSEVAKFSAANILKILWQTPGFGAGDFPAALRQTFLGIDEAMLTPAGKAELKSYLDEADSDLENMAGCTANFAMILDGILHVANSGDTRCVLARGGSAVEMSYDHKPEQETERDRIYSAGGFVTAEGRVNGNLNLSRSLGDFEYKGNPDLPPERQIITANPDVKSVQLTPQDEFLILACDGVWDILSS
jgi:serine/threonine protein phosphatase PrpC